MSIEIINMRNECPSKPYDFRIDRKTPLGNPFEINLDEGLTRDIVCDKYEHYFLGMVNREELACMSYLNKMLLSLKEHGKIRLFCWCAPKRCHGETIKAWIESQEPRP
jgi:hypothetical protein